MKKLALTVLTLLFCATTFGQNLSGRVVEVTENGDTTAVFMASLQWMHTSSGTLTDANGYFSLPYEKTDTLVVSFPTYQPDTMVLGRSHNDITIVLTHAHSLSEVSIISRDGSFISTQPILTTMISQQGLRRAACCNLAESFESTVAVDMEYSDAITGAKQISMLGLAGIYSQILLENVPYIRILTHQFGLGFVPGAWMEAISISKGVSSVTNGYEAITGQINVDYKKPETNDERLFLNLFGNTMGKGELNMTTRFKVGNDASSILMLYAGDQFAKIDMNKDGFLDVPRNQQINVMNRWDYEVHGKMEGRTMADFVWDNRVGGQKDYDWRKDFCSSDVYGLHIDNKKWDVITKNGFLLNGEHESIGTILSYTGHKTTGVFGQQLYNAFQNSLYANILYSNKFGAKERHKLTAGGSLQYDWFCEDLQHYGDIASLNLATPLQEAVPGVFAEYCYIIDPKLVLMAGMRLDYNFLYNKLFWTPRIHIKWQATKDLAIRASAGKGYRTSHILTENLSLLTSNRDYLILDARQPEEAYNAGISLVQSFNMPGGKSSVAVDYFYTHFINQTIVDLDEDVHGISVYNLNGNHNGFNNISRAHSAQIEVTLKPFQRFELILAYRYNDSKYMVNGVLRDKVLMSPHKGLFNVNYSTKFDKWKFNVTLQVNGPQRLPDMSNNPAANLPEYSPTYCILNAQITKKFRHWEIYVGGENLLNYKQHNPIISSDDPFGENFDATVVYAPITGIMGYVGVRYVLK